MAELGNPASRGIKDNSSLGKVCTLIIVLYFIKTVGRLSKRPKSTVAERLSRGKSFCQMHWLWLLPLSLFKQRTASKAKWSAKLDVPHSPS